MIKLVAMAPDEVEDATAEFGARVQIVSPPPDQKIVFEPPATGFLKRDNAGLLLQQFWRTRGVSSRLMVGSNRNSPDGAVVAPKGPFVQSCLLSSVLYGSEGRSP